jgi:hypothetical protein
MSEINFESEDLNLLWDIYSDKFNQKYGNSKGSLIKFKKFINDEPHRNTVLKRLSESIDTFDELKATETIYLIMTYIHNDFLPNFNKYVSDTENYRQKNNINNDEVLYNKLVLLRSMKDGENFLKLFRKFYDYYMNSVRKAYEIVYEKEPESNEELMICFVDLYNKIDINIKMYHYDFCLEIINMLKRTVPKILDAIYSDQAGCCVATPTFNILDILIESLRNLIQILRNN